MLLVSACCLIVVGIAVKIFLQIMCVKTSAKDPKVRGQCSDVVKGQWMLKRGRTGCWLRYWCSCVKVMDLLDMEAAICRKL